MPKRRKKVNPIIRTLIISDFFLFSSVGLLAPLFAVFVLDTIENKLEIIGYAVSAYWLTRMVMVTPLSRLMDKIRGERDEYLFMIIGTTMISCVPLLYMISSEPWHIYLIQMFNGFAHSMAVPAWRILFTSNIDKSIMGFEWSLEDVGVGIATALSASLGAFIVDKFGFNALFVTMFSFGLLSSLILLFFYRKKRSLVLELVQQKGDKAPLKIDTFK